MPSPHRRRVWSRGALALLVFVLTLGAVELVLQARGAFPREVEQLAAREADGILTLDLKGKGAAKDLIELPRAPRPGTTRTILAGDSTIWGFHLRPRTTIPRFLEPMLERLSGGEHEVVNLGSPGISAERVRALAEYALRELSPELVVVYTGHNEFFAPHLLPVIEDCERPLRGAVLGALGDSALGRALLAALPARTMHETFVHPVDVLAAGAILPRSRTAPARPRVVDAYGRTIERLVAAAREHGVRLLLVTPVSNGRRYGPTASCFSRAFDEDERARFLRQLDEARAALEAGELEQVERALDAAAAIDPGVAELVHLRARLAWARGDDELARRLDLEKHDLDDAPRAASARLVARLVEVAERTDTALLDLRPTLERRPAPGEPPLFLDAVHPTVRGQYLIAREIALACARLEGFLEREPTERDELASRLPSYEEACATLGLSPEFRAQADRMQILGDVDQACVALDPAPYLRRARAELTALPETALRSGSLVLADLMLSILEGDRERILRRAADARRANAASFEHLLETLAHQPRLLAGLARAGLAIDDLRAAP